MFQPIKYNEVFCNVIEEKEVQKINKTRFRDKIVSHLVTLPEQDRYMRFGYKVKDEQIEKYVDSISDKDILFAIFNLDLDIIALAHFAIDGDTAEIGLSVLEKYKKQKYGSKLFRRMIITARVLGISNLFVQCLGENKAMQSMARKYSFNVYSEYGESEGKIELDIAQPSEILEYSMTEQLSFYDFMFKAKMSTFKNISEILRG